MNQYPPGDPNQPPNQQPNYTPPPNQQPNYPPPNQSGDYGQYPGPPNYPPPYVDPTPAAQQGYPPYPDPSSQQPYGQPSVPPTQYASPGSSPQYGQSPMVPPPYGQPPYGQPPYGQPSYAPPPKKSNRTLWIVLGIVAAVIVLVCGGSLLAVVLAARTVGGGVVNAVATTQAQTSATLTAEPTFAVPTDAPAPTATTGPSNQNPVPSGTHLAVGKPGTVGQWQATVNSVTTNPGDGNFNTPKSGDTFLLVDVTIVNNTSSSQPVSSLLMFTLKDPSGGTYDQSFDNISTPPPDGTLAAGASLHGVFTYDVPLTQHTYTFTFQPDLVSDGQAIWDVTF